MTDALMDNWEEHFQSPLCQQGTNNFKAILYEEYITSSMGWNLFRIQNKFAMAEVSGNDSKHVVVVTAILLV